MDRQGRQGTDAPSPSRVKTAVHNSAELSFEKLFGHAAVVICDAPGRANLIGEHTDYNGGFVLPTVIPQRTRVQLAPRNDDFVRVTSMEAERPGEIAEYALGAERPGRDWLDYIQGITKILRAENYKIRGFEARIESDVPLGSGLASSAALEVSLARALREAFALELDDLRIAQIGQRAENEFVGANVGIMDQMASSLGSTGSALIIDTHTLHFETVPLPAQLELVIINSGVSHNHAGGEYNTRRNECKRACQLLGVAELSELSRADLYKLAVLPEPLQRRVRHVITENDRVLDAVNAIYAGDVACLGELFYASHRSMRDDFEISIPEIDLLVELAAADPDVYGARLTGGGFGGSVVILAMQGKARKVATRVAKNYARQSGRQPAILVPV